MHEPEITLAELTREQFRRTPWLLLSLTMHAIVLLLFWLLPAPARAPEALAVAVQPTAPPPELPAPPPPPPPLDPVPVEDPRELPAVDLPRADTPLALEPAELPLDVASPEFDVASLAAAIGLGPGAPRGRGRPGGGGGGGGRIPYETIDRALDWLAVHQDADGKWDADEFMKHDRSANPCDGAGNGVHDVGVTGLALLAFLGDGHTLRAGRHRDVVKRAVQWLRQQQDPASGRFGGAASHDFIYDHAIAAYAICEACGLSESPLLRPYAQRGIDYLAAHRNPYGVWRYQPRDGDNDTSVTAWAVMAHKSAKDFGLQVDARALQDAAAWFDSVTDPATGKAGYTTRGGLSSRHAGEHAQRFPPERTEAMTAAALVGRLFLGQDPRQTPVMAAAARALLARPPQWDEAAGTIDHYYWYYASYALYQLGGAAWQQWSGKLNAALVTTQRQDGDFRGSWDPRCAWGRDGGRVYSTAILALTLQAYYRDTRLIR